MILFSMSDGYLNNMAMMFGPKSGRAELQEPIAAILVATLAIALTVGSVFGNLVVKAL